MIVGYWDPHHQGEAYSHSNWCGKRGIFLVGRALIFSWQNQLSSMKKTLEQLYSLLFSYLFIQS